MPYSLVIVPLISWYWVAGLYALFILALVLGAHWNLRKWHFRFLAGTVVALAILNPSIRTENREYLDDIALILVDHTMSQTIGNRPSRTDEMVHSVSDGILRLGSVELRVEELRNDPDESSSGTLLKSVLAQSLGNVDPDRLAGIVIVTDGQIHDEHIDLNPTVPAHVLIAGDRDEFDRRVSLKGVPAYSIVGETVRFFIRVEEFGLRPAEADGNASVRIAIGSEPLTEIVVPVNEEVKIPVELRNRGENTVYFSTPVLSSELTESNNLVSASVNAVHDRLRVLLISGSPHIGMRTWRNYLRSDGSVDLVHFTILRTAEDESSVPNEELSLIPFPTQELFEAKIDDFDLIIFDRYQALGHMLPEYFENVTRYVEQGGAVLVAAGQEFATRNGLGQTAMGSIIPGKPLPLVLERGYNPQVSAVGQRHPVTDPFAVSPGETAEPEVRPWGRWFRQTAISDVSGDILMTGMDDFPLLVVSRSGEGRVALLSSDQIWMWHRGIEGGGPHRELLRRLAHWLMKEPELEEDALTVRSSGDRLEVYRRSLVEYEEEVLIELPDGSTQTLPLLEQSPGEYLGTLPQATPGLYQISDSGKSAVAMVGFPHSEEFENVVATDAMLAPLASDTGAMVSWYQDGIPSFRRVQADRLKSGPGWAGLVARNSYRTDEIWLKPLIHPILAMVLMVILASIAWWQEGRRESLGSHLS